MSQSPVRAAPSVALVHDYLTQRGGAERVVLAMTRAFPGTALYTSLYHPEATYPELSGVNVRPGPLNRVSLLRHHHRLALPLLAPTFSFMRVEADVVLCSSSGWAHGVRVSGSKVVYCYTPARWLYQPERYLADQGRSLARVALGALTPTLRRWDRARAATASRYIAISSVVRARIREIYGIDSEVLHPPPALGPGGPQAAVHGLEPGFVLCVSRLLAYKNVDAVIAAVASLPGQALVVVGAGPMASKLAAGAPSNVRLLGAVPDDQLRWLYERCSAVVAASYEDFGLVPLEAAGFGKPSVVLRWGGYLDTVAEGETGVFFDLPQPAAISRAILEVAGANWSQPVLRARACLFSEERFVARLRQIVSEESVAR